MTPSFFSVAFAIARKDLQSELRSRELIATMLLFALLSVLIFSFALQLDQVAQAASVSGVLWVTVVFASVLGLNRSMAMEREQGGMDAMLLAPIDRSAIFLGKLVGNLLFTGLVGAILLPLTTVLYDTPVLQSWTVLILLLGTLGICTTGTLLSAMTAQTRSGGEALLPIVMLPVVLPLLIAAVTATTGAINESPLSDWQSSVQILAVVDVIYLALCFVGFGYVVEE